MKRAVAAMLVAAALFAAPRAASAEPPHDLHFTTAIDLPITLTLFGGHQLSELVFKPLLAPSKAGWRERALDGTDLLNVFDRVGRRLRWVDPREAARFSDFLLIMSNITSQSLTYVASTIDGDSGVHGAENVLMILEATSIAAATNQLAKFLVGRQRPCSRFALVGATSPCFGDHLDDNLSFFSGHAAVTSALAASSGTVASLRGYSLAPIVWATGALVAVTTGGMRLAADKHYLSDVLAGFVIGSTIGALVPLLAHRRIDHASPSTGAAPPLGGTAFSYAGTF